MECRSSLTIAIAKETERKERERERQRERARIAKQDLVTRATHFHLCRPEGNRSWLIGPSVTMPRILIGLLFVCYSFIYFFRQLNPSACSQPNRRAFTTNKAIQQKRSRHLREREREKNLAIRLANSSSDSPAARHLQLPYKDCQLSPHEKEGYHLRDAGFFSVLPATQTQTYARRWKPHIYNGTIISLILIRSVKDSGRTPTTTVTTTTTRRRKSCPTRQID